MSGIVAFAYLVSAVCFILALRGLASPETARQGNLFGIAGMALAIVTTMLTPAVTLQSWFVIALGIAIGGSVGYTIARRIKMTALPQLVAAFHSLVGLAAVLVATAAYLSPDDWLA